MSCTEHYPPSSRPSAMVSTLNSWLPLNFSSCLAADERLSLFSAFKLSLYLFQSICLPLYPRQSGLSLKLSNQHAVSSNSQSCFIGLSPCFFWLFFFASCPFFLLLCLLVALLQSRAQHEVSRRSHTGTRKRREKHRGRKSVNKITTYLKQQSK